MSSAALLPASRTTLGAAWHRPRRDVPRRLVVFAPAPRFPTVASAGAFVPRLRATTASASAAEDIWGPWDPPLPPLDPHPPLLSFDVARELLDARDAGASAVDATLDFGITTRSLSLRADGVLLDPSPDDASPLVTWDDIATVADDEKGAYVLTPGAPAERFQAFSEATSRAVSLMPSGAGTAPTALIAGFSMHRFGVGVDPMEDTARKIGAVHPIRPGARVLDICTGLAYTACGAHAKGGRVTTIELDPTMTKMCQMNPHSAALFSGEIQQLYGNAADVVPTLPDGEFDRIVHDPPTFALAGELFSREFYGHLLRILKPKGRLYHYIGDPASKSAGNVARGAVTRLKEAGFGGVVIDYDAHGIVAARGTVKISGRSRPGPQKSFGKAARGGRGERGREKKGGRGGKSDGRARRGRGRGGGRGGFRDDDDDEGELANEFF